MRTLGSVLFLLLLAIFGFGFSLAHNYSLAQELAATRQDLATLQAQSQDLQSRYKELELQKQQLTTQVQGLTNENSDLRARITRLETERTTLTRQIETYQTRLTTFEQMHPVLTWLTTSTAGRLASLLVLPSLPLSFGAIYAIKARRKVTGRHHNTSPSGNPAHVLLTPEERHLIAQHRRTC